jgi:cytidylate kinase
MNRRVLVAIDGPGGAGKSTIARRLAARLGFLYIDTGAMYRAVALWAARQNIEAANTQALEQLAIAAQIGLSSAPLRVTLNGEDVTEAIRAPEMSQAASKISAIPGVRRALVDKQRGYGETNSIVMEGRDIGSVVFPNADVKIYLDADPEVRATRRVQELAQRSIAASREEVLSDLIERDRRDSTRPDSPLMQAPDAIFVDSSSYTIDEVEELILKIIRDRTANGKDYQR